MYLLEYLAAYLGVVLQGCVSCLEVGLILTIFWGFCSLLLVMGCGLVLLM